MQVDPGGPTPRQDAQDGPDGAIALPKDPKASEGEGLRHGPPGGLPPVRPVDAWPARPKKGGPGHAQASGDGAIRSSSPRRRPIVKGARLGGRPRRIRDPDDPSEARVPT